jgi:hypothetical protein
MDTVEKALTTMLKILKTPDITDDEYVVFLHLVSTVRGVVGWENKIGRLANEFYQVVLGESKRDYLDNVAELPAAAENGLKIERDNDIDHIQGILEEWRRVTKGARQTRLAAE